MYELVICDTPSLSSLYSRLLSPCYLPHIRYCPYLAVFMAFRESLDNNDWLSDPMSVHLDSRWDANWVTDAIRLYAHAR